MAVSRHGPIILTTEGDAIELLRRHRATTVSTKYTRFTGDDAVDAVLHTAVSELTMPFRMDKRIKIGQFGEADLSQHALVLYLKYEGIGRKFARHFGLTKPNFKISTYMTSAGKVEVRALATPTSALVITERKGMGKVFFADTDDKGNLYIIALAGFDLISVPVKVAGKYGFLSYVNLRTMGFTGPIDWEKRIEDVKKFETWYPLYGVYYIPKYELERGASMLLDADLAGMLARATKRKR